MENMSEKVARQFLLGSSWSVGTKVKLKYDDADENQPAVGKVAEIVKVHASVSPHWLDIEVAGKTYTVRGNDCIRVG